jgi:hypothetical protein
MGISSVNPLEFTSIKIEAYISSSWVDISADVLQNPPPSWNMGIMGNSPIDRLGDPEMLTFSMRNGEDNTAGLVGYYTPGNPNCRSGWGVGVPVRLVFTYEAQPYYKYYGKIAPDGIKTAPGIYGERVVSVTAEGFMSIAERHILALMALQTSKTIAQAVPYILANMPVQPLTAEYGTPTYTFPTVFDTIGGNTSAVSELQKLAISEWSYIYTKGNITNGQTLVIEGKGDRTNRTNTKVPITGTDGGFFLKEDGGYLLKEDGWKIIIDDLQSIDFINISLYGLKSQYGANLSNAITGRVYPRVVDAAATTVLFETQRRIYVEGSSTVSGIRGRYRDPDGAASYINGRDMTTPLVGGTDYNATANEDGTGTSLTADIIVTPTYGTEQVEYTIQNTIGAGAWVYIKAIGKGIYLYDPLDKLFEDATSKIAYGKYPLTIDMPYQDDPMVIDSICTQILATEKEPYTTVDAYPLLANRSIADMFGFLVLEPGTRAHFSEPVTGIDANFFIMGYSAKIINWKYVIWSPVLKVADDTNYWRLDEGALDSTTILDT